MRLVGLQNGLVNIPARMVQVADTPSVDPILYAGLFYAFVVASAVVNATTLGFDADAYYYFTVASNLAAGTGSTFDGVSVTTGYHPLWLGVSTAVYYLFSDLTQFHYAIYSVLTILFLAGHALLARVAVQMGLSLRVFMLVSFPVIAINLSLFQKGLENTLLFFLLSVFVWLHFQSWNRKPLSVALTAFLLLLIYFTRLDSVFLIAPYLAWYLVKHRRDGNLAVTLTLPAIVTAGILAHLVFMAAAFGTIFSTSQIASREFLSVDASSNIIQAFAPSSHLLTFRIEQLLGSLNIGRSGYVEYLGLVVPISLIFVLLVLIKRDLLRRLPLILIGLMSVLQLFYYAVFMNGWMRPWYFSGWFIVVAFALAFMLSGVLNKLPAVSTAAVIAVAMVVLVAVNIERNEPSWTNIARHSQLLNEYGKEENVLVGYTPDAAAFLSGASIRHLEGLMNGYDYLRTYLEPGKIATYLSDINATHFVISNPVLQEQIPCNIEIARDRDGSLVAIGRYDKHNPYIGIYRISVGPPSTNRSSLDAGTDCGPGTKVTS